MTALERARRIARGQVAEGNTCRPHTVEEAEDLIAAAILAAEADAMTPGKCACGSEDTFVRRRNGWEEFLCRGCNLLAGHSVATKGGDR